MGRSAYSAENVNCVSGLRRNNRTAEHFLGSAFLQFLSSCVLKPTLFALEYRPSEPKST